MRVAHLSNIANVGYMNVQALRKKNVDARLYYNPVDPYGISNPVWEDKELGKDMPEWLREWRFKANLFNAPYHVRFLKEFRAFDIIHAYTLSPMYALFTGVPYVVQTTGADITEVSREMSALGALYRLSLRKAKAVLFSNFNQLHDMRRLGLANARFIPFSIDTKKYAAEGRGDSGEKLVLLHSSRLDWKSKGNDRFFRAFSRFVASYPDALVYVPLAGPDAEKTKSLVKDLGISGNVVFLPQLTKDGIREYYQKADLVVDQFVVGGFGINALEAMSSGKPVLIYCDEDAAARCYGRIPPVLNARQDDEILSQLQKATDRSYRERIGEEARRWAVEYHDNDKVGDMLVDIYVEIKDDGI